MKLAIMQPYLFPYLGYFQLVAAVDKFVFLDDVNFRKRGWINRNRFFLGGDARYITVPLENASQFKKINEVLIQKSDAWRWRTAESMRHSYSKAPHYRVINELFSEVMFSDETHISAVAKRSVTAVAKYLDLKTEFVASSSSYDNGGLNGAERILDICRRERASQYFNLPGGRELYDTSSFESNGMSLHFIEPTLNAYRQVSEQFHSGLSIIDVLMFNEKKAVLEMLQSGRSLP
ncbi:MAG TPA: WbqC family protein [Noviherbaspirillum sp.]|nr:WbqC family protein [Noviherbaspirillum sp.]